MPANDNRKAFNVQRAKILHAARYDPNLNGTDYRVLAILFDFADAATGECFPSHDRLAAKCNLTVAGARKAVYRLAEHGYLHSQTSPLPSGKGKQNHYTFRLPKSDTDHSPENSSGSADHYPEKSSETADHCDENSSRSADHCPENEQPLPRKNMTTALFEHAYIDEPSSYPSSSSSSSDDEESAASLFKKLTKGLVFANEEILDALVCDGADLERDVVPTVLAVLKEMNGNVRSWKYLEQRIQTAMAMRKVGGFNANGVATEIETEELWLKRLARARIDMRWYPKWGPIPHHDGCRVPPDLLLPEDGDGWRNWRWDDWQHNWVPVERATP